MAGTFNGHLKGMLPECRRNNFGWFQNVPTPPAKRRHLIFLFFVCEILLSLNAALAVYYNLEKEVRARAWSAGHFSPQWLQGTTLSGCLSVYGSSGATTHEPCNVQGLDRFAAVFVYLRRRAKKTPLYS